MSEQDALDLLTATYKIEVERRLRTFTLDSNTTENLSMLASYLTQERPRFGIMCCGSCGNGKTTLLYAFQRAVNFLQSRRHFAFLDDEYGCFKASMEIFDAKEILALAKDYTKFRSTISKPMIAIDDMGKEATEILEYGNTLNPLIDLIEYRYNHQLFTFITTNLVAKEATPETITIRKKYGSRIADRFNEMLHVIVFKDISYRTLS